MNGAHSTSDRRLAASVKIVWAAVAVVVLIGILRSASSGAPVQRTSGVSNIKQVGLGLLMYANDYDDRMPPAMASNEQLRRYNMPYLKNATLFISVNPDGGQILGNGMLAGKDSKAIVDEASTVMLYDSRPWRAIYALVCFADGHAKSNVAFETMLHQLTINPFGQSKDTPHG